MATLNAQPHRLLIVARRFWPHTEDACHRLLHWAVALKQRGVEPEFLTARWNSIWPESCVLREISIKRLLPPPHSNWNESHLQKNMVQWIASQLHNFDAIYVDRTDSLLQVMTTKGLSWRKPILCRFAPRESAIGLAPATRLATTAMADAARRANLICVNNPADHRFLVSQGVHDACILRTEDQPTSWLARTDESRSSARRALARLASDMVVPEKTNLMVHVGATHWPDLRNVLMSICDLLDSGASIRMWVINPQISYPTIYEFLKDRGWQREVLIFDGFDDLDEIVQAADLGWFTNPYESLQYSLPHFLGAGVPVLVQEVSDLPVWAKELLSDSLFGSPTDLALKLHRWYANQADMNQKAAKRRAAYFQHCSNHDIAKVWKESLDKLTGVVKA